MLLYLSKSEENVATEREEEVMTIFGDRDECKCTRLLSYWTLGNQMRRWRPRGSEEIDDDGIWSLTKISRRELG